MRHPVPFCIATLLLITALATAAPAATPESPTDTEPAVARAIALTPRVRALASDLVEQSLAQASAEAIIARLREARSNPSLSAIEQDALLHTYLRALRPLAPRAIPVAVLHWMEGLPARAVRGHPEGAHHAVPVFNIAAEARGLLNQWAWQDGHDAVAGPNHLAAEHLARRFTDTPQNHPSARGMRRGLQRLTSIELDQLSAACATTATGCGPMRADIEVARGNAGWLMPWLAVARPQDALPRLRDIRRTWSRADARPLIETAVNHPDPGVAGWAIADLTAHLPKDAGARRAWGARLLSLLGNRELGAAAALQLARLDSEDWLEAATTKPMSDLARQRLSLIAEAEALRGDGSMER